MTASPSIKPVVWIGSTRHYAPQLQAPQPPCTPVPAKIVAVVLPSIRNAAHTRVLHPNETSRLNPAARFGSMPSPLHVVDPRIAALGGLKSCLVCSRSAVASRSGESVPRQPERAVSIQDAWQESARLRRPPAGKAVMWERAAKPAEAYPHSH